MRLAQLPGSVLAEIFSGEAYSHLLIPIWKCGDSLLNQKLALNVHSIILKDERLASTSRYPKFISCLKNLRYLDINRYRAHLISSLTEQVMLIGAKLDTLIISSASYLDLALWPKRRAPPFHSHPCPSKIGFSTEEHSKNLDLSACCPNLRTFRWTELETEDGLVKLPDTITKLSIRYFYVSENTEWYIFAQLPRSLEIFDTCIQLDQNFPPSLFTGAPVGLHTLTKLQFLLFPSDFHSWPGSLVHCVLKPIHPYPLLTWTNENIQSLPPWLNYIKMTQIDQHDFNRIGNIAWAAQLPSTLQTLIVSPGNSLPLHKSEFISSLPKTLTRLEALDFNSCRRWDIDDPVHNDPAHCLSHSSTSFENHRESWPPLLSILKIPLSNVCQRFLDTLPPTLTALSCHYNDASLSPPVGLSALDLGQRNSHIKIRLQQPLMLTYLATNSASLGNLSLPSLHTLKLYNAFILLNGNIDLQISTPNLTTLKAAGCDSNLLNRLPSTLTSLRLSISSSEESIHHLCAAQDAFAHLPTGLKSMRLSMDCEDSHIPPLSAPSLSKLSHLEKLKALCFPSFQPSTLRHLPPSCRVLELRLSHLDELSARCLSPYLKKLKIYFDGEDTDEHELLLARNWPLEPSFSQNSSLLAEIAFNATKEARMRSFQTPDPRVLS